jgi:hypothetical protein
LNRTYDSGKVQGSAKPRRFKGTKAARARGFVICLNFRTGWNARTFSSPDTMPCAGRLLNSSRLGHSTAFYGFFKELLNLDPYAEGPLVAFVRAAVQGGQCERAVRVLEKC